MSTVSLSTKLDVKPDQVWELFGKFNTLADWHPAVEKRTTPDNPAGYELAAKSG